MAEDQNGNRVYVPDESDAADEARKKQIVDEFVKLRRSQNKSKEEKMYMDLIQSKNAMSRNLGGAK